MNEWTYFGDDRSGGVEIIMVDGERVGTIYQETWGWTAETWEWTEQDIRRESLGDFAMKRDAAQAAAAGFASGHQITLCRRNLGHYPIAGWNAPILGWEVNCTCGFHSPARLGAGRGSTSAPKRARLHLKGELG